MRHRQQVFLPATFVVQQNNSEEDVVDGNCRAHSVLGWVILLVRASCPVQQEMQVGVSGRLTNLKLLENAHEMLVLVFKPLLVCKDVLYMNSCSLALALQVVILVLEHLHLLLQLRQLLLLAFAAASSGLPVAEHPASREYIVRTSCVASFSWLHVKGIFQHRSPYSTKILNFAGMQHVPCIRIDFADNAQNSAADQYNSSTKYANTARTPRSDCNYAILLNTVDIHARLRRFRSELRHEIGSHTHLRALLCSILSCSSGPAPPSECIPDPLTELGACWRVCCTPCIS